MRVSTTKRIWTCLALVMALGGAASPAAAAALGDCDAPGFAQILFPAPRALAKNVEAAALWLDHTRIKWPGMEATHTFALYHAGNGGVIAETGAVVTGADGKIVLAVDKTALPKALLERFNYAGSGVVIRVPADAQKKIDALLQGEIVLVAETADGKIVKATRVQIAGALDSRYQAAEKTSGLGVTLRPRATEFKLWAPTARAVFACIYPDGQSKAISVAALTRNADTGVWARVLARTWAAHYTTYLVEVFVPGVGVVRNRVTDPYAVSLTTDSTRAYIADLDAPALKPKGWDTHKIPTRVRAQTDMVIYELHVRDFSINDQTVMAANRGKYAAFTETQSNGMKHLAALSQAGLTDIHLLPVFDIATIPESACTTPTIKPPATPDSEEPQATVSVGTAKDCFNWGYDPFHFNAPEGSYASNAADGARRVIEFRQMVQALHVLGLRVGMDVVYNHTAHSGQHEKSVLDRIVPGYYHRLNAKGEVERSTCCDNTATEHMMMAKLMSDSVSLWARAYKIDSFRFDLMGHQPKSVMLETQNRLKREAGRAVQLLGEGWNFGEVENGKRFVQASQLSLNGTGIGTFSDRARDAIRGGGPADSGAAMMTQQGYINGLIYDRNAEADAQRPVSDLLKAADMVRVGLAGSIRGYRFITHTDDEKPLEKIDYNGQPAGYVKEPGEVVNYVENHDNQTLFDMNAYKLPMGASREDRARVQVLGAALNAFSQGVAYFHAGIDTLRSKSLDRNSYDSGDWFNRIDWTYQDNYFGMGLPPKNDNGKDYALMRPRLTNTGIKPSPADIAWTRDAFRDLLRIRASTNLFRLPSAAEIKSRLTFYNVGSKQEGTVIVGHLKGGAGYGFRELIYFVNVDKAAHTVAVPQEKGKRYGLHPVHLAKDAADKRPAAAARYDDASGSFTIPARTAVVFVRAL